MTTSVTGPLPQTVGQPLTVESENSNSKMNTTSKKISTFISAIFEIISKLFALIGYMFQKPTTIQETLTPSSSVENKPNTSNPLHTDPRDYECLKQEFDEKFKTHDDLLNKPNTSNPLHTHPNYYEYLEQEFEQAFKTPPQNFLEKKLNTF